MTNKPAKQTHSIYAVTGEGEASRWICIGAAWPDQDGKGFGMKLDMVPITGRLVMREPKPEASKGGQQ